MTLTLVEQAFQRHKEQGEITKTDLEACRNHLRQPLNGDSYQALLMVGKYGSTIDRGLVVPFLHCPEDPMMSKLALQILCSYWGEIDQYRQNVNRFLIGVPWDTEEDCRMGALSVAGAHLRTTNDQELLDLVLEALRDAEASRFVREAAYEAILRASGLGWSELLPLATAFERNHAADEELVAKLRARME